MVQNNHSEDQAKVDKATSISLSSGIHTHAVHTSWALITEQSTYALGVTNEGYILNLHWGPRLLTLDDLPVPLLPPDRSSQDLLANAREEYPGAGGLHYGETAAKVLFADGVRDLDLRYQRFEVEEADACDGLPVLTLFLRDTVYPLLVTLRYQVDTVNDLIIRSATFTNEGSDTIRLERVFSAVWHLPSQYTPRILTTLAGQWSEETRIQRRPITAGTALVESRRGITSLQAAPWFAIEPEHNPFTPAGQHEVYFGALAWSGNWAIRVTGDVNGTTVIAGGISDHDFVWQLGADESFATPDFIAGFAFDGLNGARQRLHRYTRKIVLPQPQAHQPRPVLYNSWEATFFDVHESGQVALAERAARLGVELFVVDDGWFAGRNNDRAGLGDWYADPHKFPQGLGPLVKHVNALGMQFGLWVEPEMVNPDSNLYRAHPDWVYFFPTRPRSLARNQLVLNLGREDVRTYLFETLNRLITQHAIAFLKWDMNRPISEPGWSEYLESGGEAREIWVRHARGVYTLMDALRAHHQDLTIESCSSGGGRADLGILRRTDQVWASDNTHPEARLLIQEGFSLELPARVMESWVTDAGRGEIPLAFRFHVAMLGALGIGGNLLHWSAEELDEAAGWIAAYKTIRPIIQEGDQCWLLSPHATGGALAAVQYTTDDQDEAVVFAFQRSRVFGEPLLPLRLQNLQANARYSIENVTVSLKLNEAKNSAVGPAQSLSGAALMARGLTLPLEHRHAYASCLLKIRRLLP